VTEGARVEGVSEGVSEVEGVGRVRRKGSFLSCRERGMNVRLPVSAKTLGKLCIQANGAVCKGARGDILCCGIYKCFLSDTKKDGICPSLMQAGHACMYGD
jgi:hypothetical protein